MEALNSNLTTREKKITKSFRLDEELWSKIEDLRFTHRYESLSGFVEDALKNYLKENETPDKK